MNLVALESFKDISDAVRTWKQKFATGAHVVKAMGGDVLCHERFGIWGHFSEWQPKTRSGHYWNPFGRIFKNFRQNMTVEINPPKSGINTNVQGVVARAQDGARWILHQGRLHPSRVRISEDMFDKVSTNARVKVKFSTGETVEYHRVANLEAAAEELQQQVCTFVSECEIVRQYYVLGPQSAADERRVVEAEALIPELKGSYVVSAQASRTVTRWHGDIWDALAKALGKLGVRCSNGRVGFYGPDLRTFGRSPILFEIKSGIRAADVQTAVGQLLLYETLIGRKFRKVLVIRDRPRSQLYDAIRRLDIELLQYSGCGRSIHFDHSALKRLVRH